ncbi:hypothetical protein JZ751_008154 [Albula glossodonta]|uniref:MANSC domain-containing protein n=1 Tax=Albula glossodonta TaxID=121402 RepID=A0A8T2N2U3_9TELE|nr:hypothetical protein JZ751_008154 [Albula glossodonta]
MNDTISRPLKRNEALHHFPKPLVLGCNVTPGRRLITMTPQLLHVLSPVILLFALPCFSFHTGPGDEPQVLNKVTLYNETQCNDECKANKSCDRYIFVEQKCYLLKCPNTTACKTVSLGDLRAIEGQNDSQTDTSRPLAQDPSSASVPSGSSTGQARPSVKKELLIEADNSSLTTSLSGVPVAPLPPSKRPSLPERPPTSPTNRTAPSQSGTVPLNASQSSPAALPTSASDAANATAMTNATVSPNTTAATTATTTVSTETTTAAPVTTTSAKATTTPASTNGTTAAMVTPDVTTATTAAAMATPTEARATTNAPTAAPPVDTKITAVTMPTTYVSMVTTTLPTNASTTVAAPIDKASVPSPVPPTGKGSTTSPPSEKPAATTAAQATSPHAPHQTTKTVVEGLQSRSLADTASLLAVLSFGVLFFIVTVILFLRRAVESYRKRDYTQMDYLINGMYSDSAL